MYLLIARYASEVQVGISFAVCEYSTKLLFTKVICSILAVFALFEFNFTAFQKKAWKSKKIAEAVENWTTTSRSKSRHIILSATETLGLEATYETFDALLDRY